MPMVSKFEQMVLFNFVRILTYLIMVLLVGTVLIGGLLFFKKLMPPSTRVSYEDVLPAQSETASSEELSPGAQERMPKLPDNVARYMKGQNYPILKGWLQGLPMKQKWDFVDNMSSVISAAEKEHPDRVIDVINRYKQVKLEKMSDAMEQRAANQVTRLAYIGYGLAAIGLAAIFTLILVLLAIERNTRRIQPAS